MGHLGLGGKEFQIPGFGIADLIWVCAPVRNKKEPHVIAFEMKLSEWRRALSQAYRYRYFADRAIVVLPSERVKLAKEALNIFKELQVGLWAFDPKTGVVDRLYTPRLARPKSLLARSRAIALIDRKLDFSKFRK